MASFGEEIKRERELRDISLKEIADATNISVRFLEALERNDFSVLPGGVYVRGFIRSVAQHVGLDVDETLAAYQQETERQEMLQESETGRGGHGRPPRTGGFKAESAVAGGFAMMALLIGIVYWAGSPGTPEAPPPDPAAHSEALKARMKRSGALPASVPSEPEIAPLAAPPLAQPEAEAVQEPGVERLVGIRALETTRVQLTCAGEVRFREDLWVGVERQFPCREPILLSAANAGAIEYSVDSQALKVLGQPGRAVRDVSITPEVPAAGDAPKPKPVQGASTARAPEAPETRP